MPNFYHSRARTSHFVGIEGSAFAGDRLVTPELRRTEMTEGGFAIEFGDRLTVGGSLGFGQIVAAGAAEYLEWTHHD
jgi:hypothetical protein